MRLSTVAITSLIYTALISASCADSAKVAPLAGMPPLHDPSNIYADAGAGKFSATVSRALQRVYVPNSLDNTVSVIDPKTYKVITTLKTGKNPQHVVPSYNLKTLWVVNDLGNSLTPINPETGTPGKTIAVNDPYNLYYTPDGHYAIVVSEARKRLDFYDTKNMKISYSLPVNCEGVNHMEFTADGNYALATCEYSGQLLKLDVANQKILAYLSLRSPNKNKLQTVVENREVTVGPLTLDVPTKVVHKTGSMPQDIRSSPDGNTFYVADMMVNGVFLIDPVSFKQTGFIPAGIGTHSIYPSRDGKVLYVANRGCSTITCGKKGKGSVSVIDPSLKKVIATWPVNGGGSPDMGNVSADGKELWLSGRYDGVVYVFNTQTGDLTHKIQVGSGPHGLTFWPQPGRYSLGHTGNMR